eukprot:CAMPEP_0175097352 /NCGR_PEP_ID=MMETSP0086_2-20121207/5241_1 /TAXON_ID=136419 /ORGANISM="Unknown Unknown, Strain D1" /LENGTH=391 /DNA_ID=CAMNT_0016370857 /DNA_START=98 /DNA_END=1274 /DNA_ORIENTATION=-
MTILLAAVLLSCVGVQGSKHVEKQAEVSVGAHHFKALQVGTTPKITSVDNLGSDKFAIYVTFATCAVGLTTDDFTFSDDFTIRDLSLQEIAPGVQFRLEGTFLPKPGANIPTSGVDVGVTLKSGAVSFVDSFTGRGVGNVVTFGSFRYNPPASSFFETTVAEVTATPSKHVSFTVTYGSLCTLSTVNPFKEGHFFSAAFSVSNEGQRPATLESAVVTHVQGMTSINVQVSTPYTDDVVTLTANAGGCVAAGGAINREAKATAVVSTAGATCGPWTAFDTSLCGTCSRYSDTFQLMSGQNAGGGRASLEECVRSPQSAETVQAYLCVRITARARMRERHCWNVRGAWIQATGVLCKPVGVLAVLIAKSPLTAAKISTGGVALDKAAARSLSS